MLFPVFCKISEISETLEDCWNLDETQKKKIIKRLLLKWHPDKNIGKSVDWIHSEKLLIKKFFSIKYMAINIQLNMISLSSGNEQFCTTMTQHIQSEMARLEQGLPRYDPNFTSKFKVSTERMFY